MVFLSGQIYAAEPTVCGQDSLFAKQKLSQSSELDISADSSEILNKNNYTFSGNASIKSDKYNLFADQINVNKSNKTAEAAGNVRFQGSDFMAIAAKASLKKQDGANSITLKNPKFHYPQSKIRGQANTITDHQKEQVLNEASYSLCPLGQSPDWQIKAKKITINSDKNIGTAEDLVLEVFGVPVLYLPYQQWVLEGRSSGFLAPTFSTYKDSKTSERAYQVKIPYYFNIAPNKDFLLSLNNLSNRGVALQGVYRQINGANNYFDDSRLRIAANYLNEDKITQNKRWSLASNFNITKQNSKLKLQLRRTSDPDYFNEVAHDGLQKSNLYSYFDWSYNNQDRGIYASLFGEDEQLVNFEVNSYTKQIEAILGKNIKIGDRNINAYIQSTKFAHEDKTLPSGIRTHFNLDFNRNIKAANYSIKPNINISKTDYKLDNQADLSRKLGRFSLDAKYFLARKTADFTQTITPRFSYYYTPNRDQSAFPLFDSADKVGFYEQLFSSQNKVGIDRIDAANDVVLGIESDFIDNNGDIFASLKVAKAFFKDDKLINNKLQKHSNIAAVANFSADKFSFINQIQFDQESGKIQQSDNAIRLDLADNKFINIAYHRDQDDKSAEFYSVFPTSQNTHIFLGVNRSITDKINNREVAGFAYESCCFAWRLAHSKEHISGTDFDDVTSFELVLKGLGSSDGSIYKRLKRLIPNYLSNLNN